MSQPRPKIRPKPRWELHVTLSAGASAPFVTKLVGENHCFVSRDCLTYDMADKKAAQEAKRRVKAVMKAKVSCEITPSSGRLEV